MADADKLIISFKFPPDSDVSGIVVAKRIINAESKVDILHNHIEGETLHIEKLDDYLNERYETSVNAERDSIECIFNYIEQGLDMIGSKDYKEIYSRSWFMSNHYLALEYKFKHPDTIWTAEFSDPVLRSIKGDFRNPDSSFIDNPEYIGKLNSKIEEIGFKPLDNPNNTFFIAEYLTFLFADKITFTNENQREVMLEPYDEEIRELVIGKSQIMPHPTLSEEFYHIHESDIELDSSDVNIAYFGSSYYITRHFEPLFYAYESLNHKYKDKIKFHIFVNIDEFLNVLTSQLDFKNNIVIRNPIPYLEFLNATTKFDVLLINDTITEGKFTVNPYLPSKYSDCKGSSKDIWILYENNSTLSKVDVKYKSSMTDFKQSCEVLVNILKDNGYEDEDYSFDEHGFEKRILGLNRTVRSEFGKRKGVSRRNDTLVLHNRKIRAENEKLKRNNEKLKEKNEKLKENNRNLKEKNQKLKDKNKELKDKLDEVFNSHSWKLTEPLRHIRNK